MILVYIFRIVIYIEVLWLFSAVGSSDVSLTNTKHGLVFCCFVNVAG